MRFFLSTIALMSVVSSLIAAPTARAPDAGEELPDGLPYPGPGELKVIEQNAHGTLPNGPAPPVISNRGILNLKLIAFNELFEVAFFSELIANITENVEGYRFTDDDDRTETLSWLKVILAQEELHAIRANNALSSFGVKPIEPCHYKFPVQDFDSAIALAMTFTDVVLGTLQDVVETFAIGKDVDLAREIASVIGQEGEQQGWFRVMQGKVPSELPFLTTSDINFAFTAIQSFVVPGTCPNILEIGLRTYETLNIITPPVAQSKNLTFSFSDTRNETSHPLWMTYINQQNLPIVEPLRVVSREGDLVKAEALFPYDDNEMNGLTIATVTFSEGPFGDANAVAKWTLAGPGLIVVN
ncbi:hypothetical protein N7448_003591 [Penicillium atrosanguineum]|uniref:Late sexual development protein n=1 Tax=Penicillium atrosanguineum TaxID=1132637 RepID=A0A9W9PWQ6_9EURO|nr:hypothetical protein N7526_009394 [Penicillium atrosanguineum]KAJ5140183.1 hypothetical protein N7448_003591 [Penicillium atrosanguineum]KAJ5315615.1 hypothetical protein N7476_005922 [Penicillium atrosanguineum]